MRPTFPLLAASSLHLVHAQATTNGISPCLNALAGQNFCAAASLITNIIIRCSGNLAQPGNCNDNLAGIPPVGVKDFAPCYQSSPTAGDAACSYAGIAYPDSGPAFNIFSGSSLSSLSSLASSTSTMSLRSTSSTSSLFTTSVTPYVPVSTVAESLATTSAAANSTSLSSGTQSVSSSVTQSTALATFTGGAEKVRTGWLVGGVGAGVVAGMVFGGV